MPRRIVTGDLVDFVIDIGQNPSRYQHFLLKGLQLFITGKYGLGSKLELQKYLLMLLRKAILLMMEPILVSMDLTITLIYSKSPFSLSLEERRYVRRIGEEKGIVWAGLELIRNKGLSSI